MHKSTMARRAAANPTIGTYRPGTPGTNPAARVIPVKAPVGAIRNRRAGKLTPLQRDSEGRMSAWSRSQSYFDAVEVDRRWHQTVSNQDFDK